MGNPDASNRCDREMPTARPRGIGRDCWTPKQIAKYGIDPADVAAEPCMRRKYQDFLYEWTDCMSACYTRRYGTQPLDANDVRELEKKKKKKKEDKDTDGDGIPDKMDTDVDGDGVPNNSDPTPGTDEDATKEKDKEDEDFPDVTPPSSPPSRRRPKRPDVKQYDESTTSWRVVTLCKAHCANIVKLDYTECFCDRTTDGNEDEPLEGTFDRDPFDTPTDDTDRPDIPDDDSTPKYDKQKLRVTDSAYGVPIEIVYGRHAVAGNVFWIAPTRREPRVAVRTLLTGASTTGNAATVIPTAVVDFAIGMCAPEIDAITRIYFNDYLFYDANSAYARVGNFTRAGVGASNGQELIDGLLYFYRGGEAQKFAREMETADEIPIGYRDLSFIVFKGLDLRAVGNKFPSLRIEVASQVDEMTVVTTAAPVITPVTARAFGTNKVFIDEAQPGAYKVMNTEGAVVYSVSGQAFDAATVTPISDQYVATQRGAVTESRSISSGAVLTTYTHPIASLATYGSKTFYVRARSAPGQIANYFVMLEGANVHFHPVTFARGLEGARTTFDVGSGVVGGMHGSYSDLNAKVVRDAAFFVKIGSDLRLVSFTLASTDGAHGFTFDLARQPTEVVIPGNIAFLGSFVTTGLAFDPVNALLIVRGRVGTKLAMIAINVATNTLAWATKYDISAPLTPVWFFAIGGLSGVMTITGDSVAHAINIRTGEIERSFAPFTSGGLDMTASNGAVLLSIGTNSLAAANLTGIVPHTIPVSDIVYDITERAHVNPSYVYLGTTDEVIGFKINTNSPAKTYLSELATVTGTAIYDDGERLRAEKIDATTYTLPDEDIGLTTSTRLQYRMRDAASRPSTQVVTYYDADRGLAPASAIFRPDVFEGFAFGDDATFVTNVVLGTQDAYLLAERLGATITLADNVAELTLGPKHGRLTPGDVVSFTGNIFGLSSFMSKDITIGADKSMKLSLRLSAAGWQSANPSAPEPPPVVVVDPQPTVDAGTPVIIQAKPVTGEDQLDYGMVFYGGIIGDIGTSALMYFLDGAYVDRVEVSKSLSVGVVLSGGEDVAPDAYGPQWEADDAITVVFDRAPDTSIWTNVPDINDVTSSTLVKNLLLIGREWVQFAKFSVALDGVTVTFSELARGLRGTDVYATDVMIGRRVYVYDEAAWGAFQISKGSAQRFPATLVTRSLTNDAAQGEVAQAIIAGDPTFNWPMDKVRVVRDMMTDFITVTWQVRARFNAPLDDQWFFKVPGIDTPSEFFIIKEDIDYARFVEAVTAIYSDVFEWNATAYVRAYVIAPSRQQLMTVSTFTTLGIDYATQKFHIVLRQPDSTINPSISGHYLVATYDPTINNGHVTGQFAEPSSYQVLTIP